MGARDRGGPIRKGMELFGLHCQVSSEPQRLRGCLDWLSFEPWKKTGIAT